jgi:hypothetical protein
MSTKRKIIQKAESLLSEAGFTQQDYVISLQGPTIILTKSGQQKLKENLILKADLIHIGIGIF